MRILGFRSHIGNILQEYMSDIVEEKKQYTGIDKGPAASWDVRDKRYHMVFDAETYKMFMISSKLIHQAN